MTNSSIQRAAVKATMAVLPLLFFGRIWLICLTAEDTRYDWMKVGWQLTVLGVMLFIGELALAVLLFTVLNDTAAQVQAPKPEDAAAEPAPSSEPRPSPRRNEQTLLIAILTSLLGGLITFFLVKRCDCRRV